MSIKKPPFFKFTNVFQKFTELKISHKILWNYFSHFERYISWKGKLFPKDLMAYFGLCKFLKNLSIFEKGRFFNGHPLVFILPGLRLLQLNAGRKKEEKKVSNLPLLFCKKITVGWIIILDFAIWFKYCVWFNYI